MTEQFLTVEEAARQLKVAPFTVRVWLRQGKIEGVKLGKVWRVLVASLDTLARPKVEDSMFNSEAADYALAELEAAKARLQTPLVAPEIAARKRAAHELDALFARLHAESESDEPLASAGAPDFAELVAAAYAERENEQL